MPDQDVVTLFDGQLPATQTLAYTCPVGHDVVSLTVDLVNTSASAVAVRIDRVPASGTDATADEAYTATVPATSDTQSALEFDLGPGDMVYLSAATAAAVNCVLQGLLQVA